MAGDLIAGQGDDGAVAISKAARSLHMQVVGLSGQGKSFFLEHLMRQDIKSGAGICLIDPHGDVYHHMVDWMARSRQHVGRKVHLINLAEGKWSVGLNPLARTTSPIHTRVGMMLAAFQVVWNDEESSGHKTLARLLRLVLRTLAEAGLSVREAPLVANAAYINVRKMIVASLDDQTLTDAWDEIDALTSSERTNQFTAVQNRLRALVETPVIKSMLGETKNVLNFTTCMQRGDIVLVNLAHKDQIEPQAAQLLGALITAEMFLAAFAREESEAQRQPFYAYIDECGDFLNPTIVKALDQTRKYGLHYVLSHQRLAQLGDTKADPIRKGIMGGAQTKAVFIQEDEEDTHELGMLLFGKEFNFELPKESMIKPAVVGYERDHVHGEAISETRGSGSSSGTSIAEGLSAGLSMADIDNPTPIISEGLTNVEGVFEGRSESVSQGRVQSRQEVLVPILEDLPTALFSKDELTHLAAMEVRKLVPRTGYLYSAETRKAVKFQTPDVEIAQPTVQQLDDFYARVVKEPTCRLADEMEVEIGLRRDSILRGHGLDDGDDGFIQSLE